MKQMQDRVKTLLAVVTLEYHNKNWLCSPKQVNEMMQEELQSLIWNFDGMIEAKKMPISQMEPASESDIQEPGEDNFYPGPISNYRRG